MVWGEYVIPVVAVGALVNLTWIALILRYRQIRSAGWLFAAAPIWLVAIAIDFAHHC